MSRKIFCSLFLLYILTGNTVLHSQGIDDVVQVSKGRSQSYMLTNDCASYFYAESGGPNSSHFQGFNVQTHEFLEDFILEVNGRLLQRSQAEAYIHHDKLIRRYAEFELEEHVSLLDSLPVLCVKLTSARKLPLTLIPLISGENVSRNYITYWTQDDEILYIAQKNHLSRTGNNDYPVWTGVYTYPESEFLSSDPDLRRHYVSYREKEGFLPGKLNFFLDGNAYIFFIIGDDKQDILSLRKKVLRKYQIYEKNMEEKIEGVRKT
ncbi:MAG: hypothetical protein V2J62_10780 [candidate division KSB1 bacterium]|nr:hypothetical protein [candidate division KSB1 bacterium]